MCLDIFNAPLESMPTLLCVGGITSVVLLDIVKLFIIFTTNYVDFPLEDAVLVKDFIKEKPLAICSDANASVSDSSIGRVFFDKINTEIDSNQYRDFYKNYQDALKLAKSVNNRSFFVMSTLANFEATTGGDPIIKIGNGDGFIHQDSLLIPDVSIAHLADRVKNLSSFYGGNLGTFVNKCGKDMVVNNNIQYVNQSDKNSAVLLMKNIAKIMYSEQTNGIGNEDAIKLIDIFNNLNDEFFGKHHGNDLDYCGGNAKIAKSITGLDKDSSILFRKKLFLLVNTLENTSVKFFDNVSCSGRVTPSSSTVVELSNLNIDVVKTSRGGLSGLQVLTKSSMTRG